MQLSAQQQNHLYNRACFGLSFSEYLKLKELEASAAVKGLFQNSFRPEMLKVFGPSPNKEILAQIRSGKLTRQQAREQVRQEVRASREKLRTLNVEWIGSMQTAESAGLEKLVYFWHDHFGVRVLNGYQVQAHNNALRSYALGDYKSLLMAVAKDGAMLSFLNNQQNIKAKPNENFARELLELYTLGRGNYSELDIKEAARAFTGWRIDRRTGEFIFDRRNHDRGVKEFLGKRGNFAGEDIIDIILENKQTARFISAKFYEFYVSDQPNSDHINEMAEHYYKSGYDTQSLLAFTFTQSWFYDEQVVRSKIKPPLELINGLNSQLGLIFNNELGWVFLQRNFGQVMFYPPSVAGWPKGKEWIDSSSLVNRMKLPAVLAGLDEVRTEESPEIDAADPLKETNRREVMQSAELGLWAYKIPDAVVDEQVDIVSTYLLGTTLPEGLRAKITEEYSKQSEARKKQWLFLTLSSLPEYQMI